MSEVRPIDANLLKENVLKNLRCDTCYKVQLLNLIDRAPTINAIGEKIIRCSDCKYYHPFKPWCDVHEDWAGGEDGFCSLAKMKGDAE